MKTLTNGLWDKIEQLNTLHKETVTAIYAVINDVDDVRYAHVGNVVKRKRKQRKMTQADMSEKIGCSRNYLAQIEQMETLSAVSFGIVCRIAYTLDMNLYEMINVEQPAET